MKTHHLKTHPEPFQKTWMGKKTAEFRLDDRDFMTGDVVILHEHRPIRGDTGREISFTISDIVRCAHWAEGMDHRWVMLSMLAPERHTIS